MQLSRDTDHDVAVTDEVVGTSSDDNHYASQPGQQVAEARVAGAAVPSPWVENPLSRRTWEFARNPPFGAFPNFTFQPSTKPQSNYSV